MKRNMIWCEPYSGNIMADLWDRQREAEGEEEEAEAEAAYEAYMDFLVDERREKEWEK